MFSFFKKLRSKISAAKVVAGTAFVSGLTLGGLGAQMVPKSEVPQRPSIEIALPAESAPYTKVNNLFGCGTIPDGGSLEVYLVPSWSDSAAKCVIPGGVMFAVKIDTVQVE